MKTIHSVLIIGAGVSGLSASYTLNQNNIQHIIVESRDRIGGRVFGDKFDGENIQYGATFVHYPQEQNHVITDLMKQLGVTHYSANYQTECFWLEGGKILTEFQKKQINKIFQHFTQQLKQEALLLKQDESIYYLTQKLISKHIKLQDEQLQKTLQWMINEYGNVEGAQIQKISAKEAEFKSMRNDVIPTCGYYKLMNIFVEYFKPKIRFNQRVIKIRYDQDAITVWTDKDQYKAKKVICSLPLGVLQANSVEFEPQLPQNYIEAINGIGVSLFNKLFVSFEEPFWGNKQGWIHFVSKKGKSNYPEALIIPTSSIPILCVQIAVQTSRKLCEASDKQIFQEFYTFLKDYVPEQYIKIRDYKLTRWHLDENSLGCYSYAKVGGSETLRSTFNQPINNKLWLVGQHTSISAYATVHGAFESGLNAGKAIVGMKEMQNDESQ